MEAPLVGATFAALLFKYLYQDFDLIFETLCSRIYCNRHRTAYLIFIIKLVSSSYENGFTPTITASVGVAFGLISLIYQWVYISHFNPTITIAEWLHRDYANWNVYYDAIIRWIYGWFNAGIYRFHVLAPSGVSVAWTVMSAIGAIGSFDAISGCCLNPDIIYRFFVVQL